MAATDDLLGKVQIQVEFYFSDSNFPRDKFLRAVAAQNEDGYVPIATLATFNRLKTLSQDVAQIALSVKDSQIVEVNSDGTMVKRKQPIPDQDNINERTLYVKGWKEGTSMEEMAETFKTYGKVLSVRIRRMKDKKPKGSSFIEFATSEEAKAANSAKTKLGDIELITLMKDEYQQAKKQKIQDIKKRKAEEKGEDDSNDKKKKKKRGNEKEEVKEEKERPRGTLLRIKGIGEGVVREVLKELFGKYGDVAFVDFKQNDPEGIIRFGQPEGAQKALEGMKESKTPIGGKVPEFSLLQGEEEEAYFQKLQDMKKNFTKGKGSFRGKKRRRF